MRNNAFGEFPVIDVEEFQHNTGIPDYHSVQTIELGELIESGVFTWARIDWADAAYSEEQYSRLCAAFEDRYWLREIGITPVGMWMRRLHYKLVYDLMPKYRPMYAQLNNGDYNPMQHGGKYGKRRDINSEFPETLLNGSNESYLSSGTDSEYEEIGMDGTVTENAMLYAEQFKAIDIMVLDDLETLFSCLYTTNVNGL